MTSVNTLYYTTQDCIPMYFVIFLLTNPFGREQQLFTSVQHILMSINLFMRGSVWPENGALHN